MSNKTCYELDVLHHYENVQFAAAIQKIVNFFIIVIVVFLLMRWCRKRIVAMRERRTPLYV